MKKSMQWVPILASSFFLATLAGCFFTGPGPSDLCAGVVCPGGEVCRGGSCFAEGAPVCEGSIDIQWVFADGIEAPGGCAGTGDDIIVQIWNPTGRALHSRPEGDIYPCSQGRVAYNAVACGLYKVDIAAADREDPGHAITFDAAASEAEVQQGQTTNFNFSLAQR